MPNVFVTGAPGVGKSTLADELKTRGYPVTTDGEADLNAKTPARLRAALTRPGVRFICGSWGRYEQYRDLLDLVVVLTVPKSTLAERLKQRSAKTGWRHRSPDDSHAIQTALLADGRGQTVEISAAGSIADIADAVLEAAAHLGTPKKSALSALRKRTSLTLRPLRNSLKPRRR